MKLFLLYKYQLAYHHVEKNLQIYCRKNMNLYERKEKSRDKPCRCSRPVVCGNEAGAAG